MPKLFGRTKSATSLNNEERTAESSGETKVKKTKSFKRIRGLLKKSKQRRAQRASQRRLAGEDQSTVYGVDVDERSVLTKNAATNSKGLEPTLVDEKQKDEKKAFILKVVLLLMDPETRRFELLQLEFDSLKARKSPTSARL